MKIEPKGYDYKGRFISYWQQIVEVEELNDGGEHLEVGPGTGFLSGRLKERGLDVQTLDMDEAVGPDILASVLAVPVENGFFESASAFEVLEHLPFQ